LRNLFTLIESSRELNL